MALNHEKMLRSNIRNHPQWRKGYQRNVVDRVPYDTQESPEWRLGWLHAEEDDLLEDLAGMDEELSPE